MFLPSYYPNFNPVEELFSEIKGFLRKIKARRFEALVEATGRVLSAEEQEAPALLDLEYGSAQPSAERSRDIN